MKKINISFLTLFFLACSSQVMAQQSPMLKFAETITADNMRAHLYFLADDLLEGRETGERGQHLAAIYIRSQFMRMGLPGGIPQTGEYFQPFFLNRTIIQDVSVQMGGATFTYGKDFVNAPGYMDSQIEGELAFLGYGIEKKEYNNLKKTKINNKIAVILSGTPDNLPKPKNRFEVIRDLRNRRINLSSKAPKAIMIVVQDSIYRVVRRMARRNSLEIASNSDPGVPTIYVSETSFEKMVNSPKWDIEDARQKLNKKDKVSTAPFAKADFLMQAEVSYESKPASNVLAILEGTDKKDEFVVVTGHYDHVGVGKEGIVYNGADDDGSGTTAVLEIAEAFSLAADAGYRPRRSIIFMTVSGEEKGLLGSEFYTENPLYSLDQTVTNLNIDMIGRIDRRYEGNQDSTNYVYIIGSDKLSSELHALHEKTNQNHLGLKLDYKYNSDNDPNRFYYRSDHYNFAKNNIPVIFYFNGTHEDYHQPGDDPEKIEYEKAAKITRLVFMTAWEVANRDERPLVDQVDER